MHFIFIFEKTDKSILLKWSDLTRGICFEDGHEVILKGI